MTQVETSFTSFSKQLNILHNSIYTFRNSNTLSPQTVSQILDTYTTIDTLISEIQYCILPTLPSNDRFDFQLFKFLERYHTLKSEFCKTQLEKRRTNLKITYYETIDLEDQDKSLMENENEKENNDKIEILDDKKLEELSNKEKLLETNTKLTSKLQNVNAIMKSTILASEMNISDLETSTSSLSNLAERYGFFGDVLVKTNTLVKSINDSSKSERQLIYRALYFFIAVCSWIVWRRILKRPIMLILWLSWRSVKLIILGGKNGKKILTTEKVVSEIISTLSSASTTVIDKTIEHTMEYAKDEL